MKLLISLGLLAYVSAIHDSHCNTFLTVKRSRSKRSPQYDYYGDDSSSAAPTTVQVTTTAQYSTTGDAGATNPPSTDDPTTQAPVSYSASVAPVSQPVVETGSPDASTTAATDFPTTLNDKFDENTGTDYLILLDATGSMQALNGPGQGRDFVIGKFNKFLATLRNQVNKQGIIDGKIAVVMFNKKAEWTQYNSIKNVKDITKRDYNPGYGTNLHDTMGCTLQKFNEESTATTKMVYVLTDGKHQVRQSTYVAHSTDDVASLVQKYRDEEDFQFSFLALINKDNPEEKRVLKEGAQKLGVYSAEIRTTNFDGANFTGMLKSVIKSMRRHNGKTRTIPACGACPKGKPGKQCRKQRKRNKANKRCQ